MTYSTSGFGLICSLEERGDGWVILARLLGPEQRIQPLGAMVSWGYDLVQDVSLEIDGQRFDIIIRTRQDPPRYYGIVMAPDT